MACSQSPSFPLPLIASAVNDPDVAFQYFGLETLEGTEVFHVRWWKTFSRDSSFQPLAQLSKKDLWIDATSKLPRKVSYERRPSRGPGAKFIVVEIFYSDYRNVNGVLYPFRIEKSLNGTPWATIAIQNVVFNSGLTDVDFLVQ